MGGRALKTKGQQGQKWRGDEGCDMYEGESVNLAESRVVGPRSGGKKDRPQQMETFNLSLSSLNPKGQALGYH